MNTHIATIQILQFEFFLCFIMYLSIQHTILFFGAFQRNVCKHQHTSPINISTCLNLSSVYVYGGLGGGGEIYIQYNVYTLSVPLDKNDSAPVARCCAYQDKELFHLPRVFSCLFSVTTRPSPAGQGKNNHYSEFFHHRLVLPVLKLY